MIIVASAKRHLGKKHLLQSSNQSWGNSFKYHPDDISEHIGSSDATNPKSFSKRTRRNCHARTIGLESRFATDSGRWERERSRLDPTKLSRENGRKIGTLLVGCEGKEDDCCAGSISRSTGSVNGRFSRIVEY